MATKSIDIPHNTSSGRFTKQRRIRKIFGKAPDYVGIYSLPLGKTFEISVFPISD